MARQFKNTAWSSRPRRVLVLLGVLGVLAGSVFGVMAALAAVWADGVGDHVSRGLADECVVGVVDGRLFGERDGVAASDFKLVSSGLSGAAPLSVPERQDVHGVGEHGVGERHVGVEHPVGGVDQGLVELRVAEPPAVRAGPVVTIQKTPPTVSSISLASGAQNPTNAGPLVWTVTFSEPVNNVVAADFGLVKGSGISGTPVIGTPTAEWRPGPGGVLERFGERRRVSRGAITNNTIGLNLTSVGSVKDAAGNTLGRAASPARPIRTTRRRRA